MQTRLKQLIVVCAVLCAGGAAAWAADLSPDTAFTPAQLTAVRAWEQQHAGTQYDATTIDRIADYLPPAIVEVYKNPVIWGAETLSCTVVPYVPATETPGFVAATKQYAPAVQYDGTHIANLAAVAGRPFPQPKTGTEVMWDYEMNNWGDTWHYRQYAPNIDPQAGTDRLADQEFWYLFFVNRTELEPMPALPKNKKGIRKGIFNHMYKPAEFLNTRMYTLRYIDPAKEDTSYLYYSQYRRIRRLSTTQRTDSIDGSDMCYDDGWGWDGHISRNTYRLLGRADLLCSRHQQMKNLTRREGQVLYSGYTYERCTPYIVEAINRDPNYLYSKRIFYIDPESFLISWEEMYDRQGQLWKMMLINSDQRQTETGKSKPVMVGYALIDLLKRHGGLNNSDHFFEPQMSLPVKQNIFTISNLQKTY